MKFFIDTADVNEIKEAESLGILDGVTTNPTLISRTGRPFKETIEEICTIVKGPVSAEVVSTDTEGIIKEGRDLAKIADNIVVKVPLIKDGLKAVKVLTSEGIKVNVTLCFSSNTSAKSYCCSLAGGNLPTTLTSSSSLGGSPIHTTKASDSKDLFKFGQDFIVKKIFCVIERSEVIIFLTNKNSNFLFCTFSQTK